MLFLHLATAFNENKSILFRKSSFINRLGEVTVPTEVLISGRDIGVIAYGANPHDLIYVRVLDIVWQLVMSGEEAASLTDDDVELLLLEILHKL